MEILKDIIAEGRAVTTVDDAIDILYNSKYHNCTIYSHSMNELDELLQKISDVIKDRNTKIDDINNQMLISIFPWKCDCGNIYCIEIDMNIFGKMAQALHPFSTVKYDVLTDSSARKPLSIKALQTLSIIGHALDK